MEKEKQDDGLVGGGKYSIPQRITHALDRAAGRVRHTGADTLHVGEDAFRFFALLGRDAGGVCIPRLANWLLHLKKETKQYKGGPEQFRASKEGKMKAN